MGIGEAIGKWSAGTGPLYQRLATALRDAIERGDIPRGTRLPPERTLARALAVSRSTIVGAYDLLRSEDLLQSRQGSGTWVAGSEPSRTVLPLEETPARAADIFPAFRSLIEGTSASITLTAACGPGLPMLDEAYEAVAREDAPLLREAHGYFPLGLPALRAAIAGRYTARGLRTDASQIMITSGAQQAVALVASLLVQRGDTVVVETPTYAGALDALALAGARLAGVPVGEHGAMTDAVRRVVAATTPRLIYLIPTFQNPTGTVMPTSARREVARVAAEWRVPVLEDDALADLDLGEEPPLPIAAVADGGPVLTAGSMSKLFWGGLRVGWVRAPEAVIARLARIKTVSDLGSSVAGQAVALRLLDRIEEARAQRRAEMRERLALLEQLLRRHLPAWTWRRPSGGAVLWARMPAGDARELAQLALRHGVEIVAGTSMTHDGSFSDHVRFPLAAHPDDLADGIARLADAWRAYAPAAGRPSTTVGVLV